MLGGAIAVDDYASAAARHWDSSRFLADAARYQEAAYLAGYIAECSFKAFLERMMPTGQPRTFGHDLLALSDAALRMAVLLLPASRRYPVAEVSPGVPGLGQWRS
jgi:HEPN domain-containing protein